MRTACLLLSILAAASALVINVPGDQPTIQTGVDAGANGDTVLVAPGTYFENVRFNGRNITVASRFLLTRDPADIAATVIDGSTPRHPDTASCVLIIDGEDSTAVLEGFTLTNGQGTLWQDEHGAGRYCEGGGVLTALCGPTIRFNLIKGNHAVRRPPGIASTGGGGIRSGDGRPRIENNVIIENDAMYGGAIVLNYCDALVRNNLVYRNRSWQADPGAPTYGAGGVWINQFHRDTNRLYNNTFVGNAAEDSTGGQSGRGGAVLVWGGRVVARGNIAWANRQRRGTQFARISGYVAMGWSDLEDTLWPGEGNFSAEPLFADSSFRLADSSPCVDAGDTAFAARDPEDSLNPGRARPPALGTVRNDVGCYGGPLAAYLAPVLIGIAEPQRAPSATRRLSAAPNPVRSATVIRLPGSIAASLFIRDASGRAVRKLAVARGVSSVAWDRRDCRGRLLPAGVYWCGLSAAGRSESLQLVVLR